MSVKFNKKKDEKQKQKKCVEKVFNLVSVIFTHHLTCWLVGNDNKIQNQSSHKTRK